MTSWECRREAPAEDINMGISSLKMVFKAMGQGEIIKGESTVREGKRFREHPAFRGQVEKENGAMQPYWHT